MNVLQTLSLGNGLARTGVQRLRHPYLVDTGCKLNVLCTFNLRPVSTGNVTIIGKKEKMAY